MRELQRARQIRRLHPTLDQSRCRARAMATYRKRGNRLRFLPQAQLPVYLPISNPNSSLADCGIAARSVMMACFNADPHLQVRVLGIAPTAWRTSLQAFAAFCVNV